MKTSLSAKESKLLLELAWEKKRLVSLPEIVRVLKVSRNHAYKLASVLCKKKWLERLKSGSYQVIPMEGGPKRVTERNPYVIGCLLEKPYFFSYATANTHYGFSTQVYSTLFVALKGRHRPISIRSAKIQFVTLSESKFFGFMEVEVMGEKVKMAEKEKALLDSLDKPQYAGGIEDVFSAFNRAKEKISYEKIVDYAIHFETTTLIQRLGFMADFLKIPISRKHRKRLLNKAQQGQVIPLATSGRFAREGELFKEWNIIQNIPGDILRSN